MTSLFTISFHNQSVTLRFAIFPFGIDKSFEFLSTHLIFTVSPGK
ncbi:MAG: hypothetical protein Q8S84_03080 [bacterium]|nr:hypothetical protein [bacterium]